MKLKRFLAFVVAFAMVMSVIPAMSLTASAADLEWVSTTKLAAYGYNFTTNAKRTDLSGYEGAFVSWNDVRTGVAAFELPAGVTFNPETQALIGLLTMTAKDNNGGTNTAGIYPIDPTAVVNESGVANARSNKGSIIGTIRSTGGNRDHDVSSIVNLSSAVVDGKIGLLISNKDGYGSNISTYKNLALSVAVVDKAVIYENGSGDVSQSMDSEWIEIEFTMSGPDGGYRDWQVTDLNGNKFTGFCYAGAADGFYPQDRQSLSSGYSYVDGFDTSTKWTSGSSKMRITVISKDNKYQVTYTIVNGETETVVAALNYNGTPDGIKLPANWVTTQGNTDFGFDNVKISAVKIAETIVDVVATYTVDDAVVGTAADRYDVAAGETGVSFAERYVVYNNDVYYAAAVTLSENANIEMTKVDRYASKAVGTVFVDGDSAYRVTGGSLITNGNFVTGDMAGWINRNLASDIEGESVAYDAEVGGNAVTISTGGSGATNSIGTKWAVTPGNTYYISFYVGGQKPASGNYQYNRVFDGSAELVPYGANMVDGQWKRFEKVFTAASDTILFQGSWASNIKYANVELLPVEVAADAFVETTIKFVDSADNSTELQDAVKVSKLPGTVINLSDYAPETITYNGNPYSKDSNNPTSFTVGDSAETVTLTYTTDAFVKFTAEAVTVIEGSDPFMPTTVTAVTGSGATTDAEGVVWEDYTNLSAGTHTINGTVDIEGKTVSGNITVNVLAETFSLKDVTTVNGQDAADANLVKFPAPVKGEFSVQFNANYASFGDLWITLKNSSQKKYFGPEQIPLGSNDTGAFRPVNGNGSGGRTTTDSNKAQLETGVNYRFFITSSAATDKYTVTIYNDDTDELVVTVENFGYRTNADYIDSIVSLTNNGKGSVTLTNIKVNAPELADLFTTYTVVATGSVSDSYTEKAVSAEDVSIRHYDGNILRSREVDGTTITLTYEETETSLGSWAIRNNVTDQSWLTEMKYLGTHDSFADTDDVFRNDGGALYGDTGATSSSSTVINQSQAQTYGALDQLNMGVRYFDVRLSRQNDGSFATVHGPAFENFRDVATTIAQFAKENPGEVIILDFQTVRDALYTEDKIGTDTGKFGPDAGDDNQYVYDALVELLTETGVMAFAAPANAWDKHYGEITNNGEKSVILLIGKERAHNCNNIFINRNGAIGGTYDKDISNYGDVVTNIENKIAAGTFGSGARFGVVHAYTTPGGLGLLTSSVIGMANENNGKWINEDLDKWMTSGYGDVFLINNVTPEIAAMYLAQMSEYNRDDFDNMYSRNDDGMDVNGVKISGATTSVPFSTEFVVEADNNTYDISLVQFDTVDVELTGDVTLTFPQISVDTTTVDVLLYNGEEVAVAKVGEAISYTTSTLGTYTVTTKEAPGVEMTVKYVADGVVVYENTAEFAYGTDAYNVPAGDFYIVKGEKAYIVNSATEQKHEVTTADQAGDVLEVELTIVSENAVLADAFHNSSDRQPWNNDDNMLFVGSSGAANLDDVDADGNATHNGGGTLGSARVALVKFNVPEVADGKAVKLHLYVAKANQNLGEGKWMKIAANVSSVEANETENAYVAGDIADIDGIVWADNAVTATGSIVSGRMDVNEWATVDVTKFVKAVAGETITFALYAPTAGFYVADREKAVLGGAYAGKAAYLTVEDATVVTAGEGANLTKNGTAFETAYVTDGDSVRVYTEEGFVAVTDGTTEYENGAVVTITGAATFVGVPDVTYVAEVDGEQFESLQAAIDAADGKTVTLIDNVVLDDKVTVEGTVTLDLNGFTVSQEKACTKHYAMIDNKGNLTVKDSSEEGTGKLSFKDTGLGDSTFEWGSYTVYNNGTLTVESGTIENITELNTTSAVHMYSAISQYSGATTINGGTISNPTYRSIRVNMGTLTINDGTLEGQVWIHPFADGIELTINGGTFAPRGVDGSSVFVSNETKDVTLSVTGGTFTTKIGCSDAEKLAGAITGGTFTATAKNGTNVALLAERFAFAENADGTFGIVYVPELPTATMTELEKDDLTFAVGITTEPTNDQFNYYKEWRAEYVLITNADVTLNATGGQDGYISYKNSVMGAEDWTNLPPVDLEIKANEPFEMLKFGTQLAGEEYAFNYGEVYFMYEFDFGAFFEKEFLKNNPGFEAKVELRIYDPADETNSYAIGEYVYSKPALPTATVTEIENEDLTFALNFKADEVTETQLEYYGDWYADFVVTVNKDVTFNAAGGADGYLSGQYDEWSNNWVNVPVKDVTLRAGETLKIMEYAAEFVGEPGLKYTYKEILEAVKDFDCGVYFTPEFLKANPDLEVTLELRMYNPENAEESYAIGETFEFTAPEIPALPTATVTEIKNEDLTFALNFKADEVTEAQLNYYGKWYADYVLTVNKDVTFNATGGKDGYLSGQYDEWSKNWVNVPVKDVTLRAGESLKIMEYAAEFMGEPGLKYTCKEILEAVKDFNCGAYFTPEFLKANPDLEVTLELRMFNYYDESISYVIGETYTFTTPEIPALPTATVTEIENEDLTFALNFKADEVTEAQLNYYGKWYADYVLTVNKDITLNAAGGKDGYLSGEYENKYTNGWYNVPVKDVTLKAGESIKIMEYAASLMGKPGLKYTYKEVYEVVKDFDCGMFLEPAFIVANPDFEVTLELRMFNYYDESISYVIGETYVFTLDDINYVAEIDGEYFETLQAAFDAAEEAGEKVTIALCADTEEVVNVAEFVIAELETNNYKVGSFVFEDVAMVVADTELTVSGEGVVTGKNATGTRFGYTTMDLGLTMVKGAQVRVGDGVDENGKIDTANGIEGSGLRFITLVDYSDTLAAIDGATLGVIITAEGSTASTKIVAEKWQDENKKDVFTSALTNLAEANYYRKFTATPYVVVDGIEFAGNDSVTRSIYQVAAGLLVKGSQDGTQYDEEALKDGSKLYAVLNAYVNQTGIRLVVKDGELKANTNYTSKGAYGLGEDELHFEVSDATYEYYTNTYSVILTALGKAEIFTDNNFWYNYIRINNNNSKVKDKVTIERVAGNDKAVKLTFAADGLLERPEEVDNTAPDLGDDGFDPEEDFNGVE